MIITCPNCQTHYQLAENAIGAAGRKVSCAQCQNSWHATPESEAPAPQQAAPKPKLVADNDAQDEDRLFGAEEEAALDAEFEQAAQEQTDDVSPQAGADDPSLADDPSPQRRRSDEAYEAKGKKKPESLDDGLKGKRRQAMHDRQMALRKKLPMGRIRSNARFALLVLFVWLIGGGLFFRTEIVRVIPDLAGVYAAIGLPVNVIGLEFENVETLRSVQNGTDVMLVTGQVRNVRGSQVHVPPIVVSILDSNGTSLYSWSVTPLSRVLGPHEKLDFEARLNSAPEDAANVKLAFAEDRAN